MGAWRIYLERVISTTRKLITKHPIVSNQLLFGTLFGAGELSQQTLRGKPQKDFANAARVGTVGGVLLAPIYQQFYKWIDWRYPQRLASVICKKIIIEQILVQPTVIVLFFVGTGLLERSKNIKKEVREKCPTIYVARSLFWPISQFINFSYVAPHLRSVYVAFAVFVWVNILCYLKSTIGQGSNLARPSEPNFTDKVKPTVSPLLLNMVHLQQKAWFAVPKRFQRLNGALRRKHTITKES